MNMQRKCNYFGIFIDDPDVLLIAGTKADIGKMIADLTAEANKFGSFCILEKRRY